MTSRDAAMFPLIASGALLGLYIFFKVYHDLMGKRKTNPPIDLTSNYACVTSVGVALPFSPPKGYNTYNIIFFLALF